MDADKEKGQAYSYISGFGSLADFMSSDEDHSTAVYRRFDRLAARDLLYYQSELARLEALQDEYDIEDAKDALGPDPDYGRDIRSYARDWEKLRRAAEGASPSDANASRGGDVKARWAARMTLAREIRETLKAYREALLQESALLALRPPARQTMTALAGYFHHRDLGADRAVPMLSGPGARLYPWEATESSSQQQLADSDYVALSPHHGADPLTVFLTTYCARLFRLPPSPSSPAGVGSGPAIAHPPAPQTARYPIRRVRVAASFITTLTAALLLFLPIYTLYHTAPTQPGVTLGLLALFTVLFAVAVAVMTGRGGPRSSGPARPTPPCSLCLSAGISWEGEKATDEEVVTAGSRPQAFGSMHQRNFRRPGGLGLSAWQTWVAGYTGMFNQSTS